MKIILPCIDWQKGNGLVPAVIQNARDGGILMLGYMNQKALLKTLRTKKVWFYSRTKKRLWMKGETSGNVLRLVDMQCDCDADSILVKAVPSGPTCHTGAYSCFGDLPRLNMLAELYGVIQNRKSKMPKRSYTAFLFREGLKKICKKVAEESREVIRAAKKESKKRVIEESADVLYHLLVLLVQRNIDFPEVIAELKRRRGR